MTITNRILQNFKILFTVNVEFKNDLDNIKKNINKKLLHNLSDNELSVKTLNEDTKIEDKKLHNMISKIRLRYNLPIIYQQVIHSYLICGKIPEHLILVGKNEVTPLIVNNPDNKKEKLVVLPLSPELSITEIQNNWDMIKFNRDILLTKIMKKNKTKKIYPRKNLKRDLKIYELKKKGESTLAIKKIINKKYNTDFILKDITDIIQDLKQTANKIISKKEK